MRPLSFRRRAVVMIGLSALIFAGLAPVAQATVSSRAQPAVAHLATVGNNSCQGLDACRDLNGNVGDNSCNDDQACRDHTGSVGNNSCNSPAACRDSSGNVGDNSCNELDACRGRSAGVGNYSCNGVAICLFGSAAVGDCQFNTATPAACVQPDGRIKRSGGPQYGNDIYNTDATGQAVHLRIYAGDFRRVYISIQNDSDVDATFTVCQCVGTQGSQTGFTFTYFVGRGSTNITSAVEAGTFTTPTLAPGEVFVIRARVEVSGAATPGSPVGRFYSLTSGSGTEEDDVAIWVQRV